MNADLDLRDGPINNLEGLGQALREELPDLLAPSAPLLQMMKMPLPAFSAPWGSLARRYSCTKQPPYQHPR